MTVARKTRLIMTHRCLEAAVSIVFPAPKLALVVLDTIDILVCARPSSRFGATLRENSGQSTPRALLLKYPLGREHNKDVTGGAVYDVFGLKEVVREALEFHKLRSHQGSA